MSIQAKVLATDLGFTEGPVFRSAGDIVCVSNNRGQIYRITLDGTAEVLTTTGGAPAGLTEGLDGMIYVAQNGGAPPVRRWSHITGGVQVVRPSGKVDWVTQDPISPNDICLGPDGLLYLTDPTLNDLRNDGRIWRCDPETGEGELLTSVPWYPNGIGFAREDDALYVASTAEKAIRRFPFSSSGLGPSEIVVQMTAGLPDGFAFDLDNNIVIGAVGEPIGGAMKIGGPGQPGSIQTWTLDGKLVDEFHPGPSQFYTNVALTADAQLIITDTVGGSVLIVDDWPVAGLPLHPFRTKGEGR